MQGVEEKRFFLLLRELRNGQPVGHHRPPIIHKPDDGCMTNGKSFTFVSLGPNITEDQGLLNIYI